MFRTSLWSLAVAASLAGCRRAELPRPESTDAVAPAQAVKTEFSYARVRTFDSGLEELGGIAISSRDEVHVAGKAGIRVLDLDGRLLRKWSTPSPARCVAVDEDGAVFVGEEATVRKYDPAGKEARAWGEKGKGRGQLLLITSIAVRGGSVFVADFGNRCIHRFDTTGDFIDDLCQRDMDEGYPGLVCPSPFLDCAVSPRGRLFVTNPGMQRVEKFSASGKLLGHWGLPGTEPEQFWGCCNPSNLTVARDGRVVTAEKVWPRVKVYTSSGRMLALMGPEHFTPKAKGLDVALDSQERIYVIDPGDGRVRVFALQP